MLWCQQCATHLGMTNATLTHPKHSQSETFSNYVSHVSCPISCYTFGIHGLITNKKVTQVALNQSLSTTLRVGGHIVALLVDTGIPPLWITKNIQLAQLQYWVSHSVTGSFPSFWWNVWQSEASSLLDDMLYRWMYMAVCKIDNNCLDPKALMPRSMLNTKKEHLEKS